MTTGHPALVKALARAFRWRQMLEEARSGSLGELAAAEKVDRSHLAHLLRLTLEAGSSRSTNRGTVRDRGARGR